MTTINDLLNATTPEADIKRDRWGRYVIPDPDTGKAKSWTRVTTLVGALEDRYNLEKWMQRNLVFGIGRRPDLFAQAASCSSTDDKQTLTSIVDQAFEAAASNSKANLGTAIHRFAERIDCGEVVDVPDQWKGDLDAYSAKLIDEGVRVVQGWTEKVLIIPEIDAAGTTDRLIESNAWALPRIGDLKTGADLTYGLGKIAAQLACYAHASHWFDPLTGELHEMPAVDQTVATAIHLPVGQGKCEFVDLDIEAGWQGVKLALSLRDWRKRKDFTVGPKPAAKPRKKAAAKVIEVEASQAKAEEVFAEAKATVELFPQRLEWLTARIEVIKEAGHAPQLVDLWREHCPNVAFIKQGGPKTNEEIDAIASVCAVVEMAQQMPFATEGDPAKANESETKLKEILK